MEWGWVGGGGVAVAKVDGKGTLDYRLSLS